MVIESNFLYGDLTYNILGCAYEAFKTIGVGFDELRYHKVFHEYLLRKGLSANYKVPYHLDYLGEKIANIEIDEIVEDKVIIELKCIRTDFIPENYAQIMTYLKMTGLRLGYLINFGLHRAYPKRIIFDERRKQDIESWDKGFFNGSFDQQLIDTIISSIRRINNLLGVAYYSKIYQAAFKIELKRNQLTFDDKVNITMGFENIKFSPFKIDYWLIEKSLLVGILAGKDKPRLYDIFRMRSYLNKLNLRHGLIAYWSTKNLQLYGIYES